MLLPSEKNFMIYNSISEPLILSLLFMDLSWWQLKIATVCKQFSLWINLSSKQPLTCF